MDALIYILLTLLAGGGLIYGLNQRQRSKRAETSAGLQATADQAAQAAQEVHDADQAAIRTDPAGAGPVVLEHAASARTDADRALDAWSKRGARR